jgi:hypothetical protein
MTSLGSECFADEITVGRLNYTTLVPAITGAITNPLSAPLLGGGNDLDLQGGNITAAAINYTTLNPPLPTGGVFTPMVQNLAGGNFNISAVNQLAASTANFLNTNLGVGTASTLSVGGNLSGNDVFVNNNLNVVGTSTHTNQINANGGIQVKSSLFTSGSGSANFGTFNISTSGQITGSSLITTVGDIRSSGGDLRLTDLSKRIYAGGADIGAVTATGVIVSGSVSATADVVAGGLVSGSTLKVTNPAVSGSAASPVNLNVTNLVVNMTNKSRGVAFVYNTSSTVLTFDVETGVVDPLKTMTVLVSAYGCTSISSPTVQLEIVRVASSSNTRFTVGTALNTAASIATPFRINVLIYRD